LRGALAALAVVGCGRLGFSPGDQPDGAVADSDAACTRQLCDDFESPALAPIWDTTNAAAGSVTIDTSVAHTGASSVRFSIASLPAPNTGMRSFIAEYTTLALGSPTVYVRAFVRLSGLPAAGNNVEMMMATETVTGNENSVFLMDDQIALYNQWSDSTSSNGMAAPTNTWFCVLWRVTRATTMTGSMEIRGDIPPRTMVNIQTEGPQLTSMIFGLTLFAMLQPTPQPAFDMWLDDLLIDDAPLACSD
jgi:hypothetical protein